MGKLNYGANAPIDMALPFSVNVDPDKPPGDRKYKDYIPKNEHRPTITPALNGAQRKPIIKHSSDYISHKDMNVLKADAKVLITEKAKELFSAESKLRQAYKNAKQLVEEATDNQKKNPSPELAKAFKILETVKPITKEEAIRKATRIHYGQDI